MVTWKVNACLRPSLSLDFYCLVVKLDFASANVTRYLYFYYFFWVILAFDKYHR